MNRRCYLRTLVVGSVVALGGCLDAFGSGEDSETNTNTDGGTARSGDGTPTTSADAETRSETDDAETSTETDDATPNPDDDLPRVTDAGLLADDRSGSLEDGYMVVDALGRGGTAHVGSVFRGRNRDGEMVFTSSCTVTGPGGDEVGSDSVPHTAYDTSDERYTELDVTFDFETRTWTTGTYTAHVTARNDDTGEESPEATVEFDVVEPFTGNEVTIDEVQGPDPQYPGGEYAHDVWLLNETDRDSSLVSAVSQRRDGGEWTQRDRHVEINLPANVDRSIYFNWTFDEPGEYEFRLDAIDDTWSLTVE